MTNKQSENFLFRILDAAINRAGEGMRVVEDYARMVLDDAHLSEQLKQLRHDLTQSVKSIDPIERIAARDTVGDVGTKIQIDTEYQRDRIGPDSAATELLHPSPASASGMIQANFSRAQQAIRTIEEFSKSIDPETAKQVEQIRYRTYTLEKAMITTVVSRKNLAAANLYVLIDASGELERRVKSLIEAKVDLIQLRDKTLTDRQLVETGRLLARLTRGSDTRLIINDRADLAVAANADGVHLGQDDVSVSDARRIVGAARMIGVSTHSIEQARQAVIDGANYIGVGPVFPSQTKQFDTHVGLGLLEAVAKEIKLPSFAIGGINLSNIEQVIGSGFTSVAVSAAITQADDPGAATSRLKQILLRHSPTI